MSLLECAMPTLDNSSHFLEKIIKVAEIKMDYITSQEINAQEFRYPHYCWQMKTHKAEFLHYIMGQSIQCNYLYTQAHPFNHCLSMRYCVLEQSAYLVIVSPRKFQISYYLLPK